MGRVKTFTNGGRLYPADLNAIEDDYEAALADWMTVASGCHQNYVAFGTTPLLLPFDQATSVDPVALPASPGVFARVMDPAGDLPAAPRTVKARLVIGLLGNSTPPGVSFTAKFRQMSVAANITPTITIYGTTVASIVTPTYAGIIYDRLVSAAVDMPIGKNIYGVTLEANANPAAGAKQLCSWQLQIARV